jgi:predicted metal-dependent enzyme (double-stranded beta helix superfamily)
MMVQPRWCRHQKAEAEEIQEGDMAGGTSHTHIHPSLEGIREIEKLVERRALFSGPELRELTVEIAGLTELWWPIIRHTTDTRWYESLVLSDALELWLIGWAPGQATPTHDHGGASGALTVAAGCLVETVHADSSLASPQRITRLQGSRAHFAPHHIHRVANEGAVNATSIHAYSPAGLEMRIYDGQPQLVAAGSTRSGER